MKVRFKSKVTRGFSLLAASLLIFVALSQLEKNLRDQGKSDLMKELKRCIINDKYIKWKIYVENPSGNKIRITINDVAMLVDESQRSLI